MTKHIGVARVAAHIDNHLKRVSQDRRIVVAIAGPPASGKSTLADALRNEISAPACVLGMDAFHFDDVILNARGHRNRKGAPHTFDVVSYTNTLRSLRATPIAEFSIPVFDRTLELTRNCAEYVSHNQKVVITEGNYLLLDSPQWTPAQELFDLTIWLDVEPAELERRIRRRWTDAGLDPTEVERRTVDNDMPNARFVIDNARPADIVVR